MKTAVAYVRCSTASQVGTSSLPRQLMYCKMWCAKNNVKLVEITADVGSGYDGYHMDYKRFKSPKKGNLGKLMAKYLSGGKRPDYILYELEDRLARSPHHYYYIREQFKALDITPIAVGFIGEIDWGVKLTPEERASIYD